MAQDQCDGSTAAWCADSGSCGAHTTALQALLLDQTRPQTAEGDQHELRRLKVASHVYDAWTALGTRIAQLADRFMDGSVDALGAILSSRADRSLVNGSAGPDTAETVDVRHANELSYEEFVCRYMAPNMPVLIRGITEGWAAQRDWALPAGYVDIDFLDRHFGGSNVMVTDTSRQADGCGVRRNMTLLQYCAWWRQHSASGRCRGGGGGGGGGGGRKTGHAAGDAGDSGDGCSMQQATLAAGAETTTSGGLEPLLYLKDWHFASEHPHYKAYETPPLFVDDWLNDYYDAKTAAPGQLSQGSGHAAQEPAHEAAALGGRHRRAGASGDVAADTAQAASCIGTSDYRFVYLGPKGSWTPLHADVLRSYSWSVNVAGAKRWLLLPSQHTHLLFDRFGRQMAPSFELTPGTEEQYPNLAEARRHVVEVCQGIGEALFVPSGWHHTVENTEDTLSINHNWLNGWNLHWGLALLRREHAEAAAAIQDCREGCSAAEFEGLVQRNMAANAGLGYAGLADLAATIATRELGRLAAFGSAAAGDAASDAAGVCTACSPAELADDKYLGAEGCSRCSEALAAAAVWAAAALAAQTGTSEAPVDTKQTVQQLNHGLHCVFNLRRALFVLDAIEFHNRSVLGNDAADPQFTMLLRQIRTVLNEFDQATASD